MLIYLAVFLERCVDPFVDEREDSVAVAFGPELTVGAVSVIGEFLGRLVMSGGVRGDTAVADTPAEECSDVGVVGVRAAGREGLIVVASTIAKVLGVSTTVRRSEFIERVNVALVVKPCMELFEDMLSI